MEEYRICRIKRDLHELRDIFLSWSAYADGYFKQKNGFDDDLIKFDKIIEELYYLVDSQE